MKVYALAAGYATRLYPLTRHVPKPLLELGGRAILSRILDRIGAAAAAAHTPLDEIVVITNARFAPAFRSWAEAERWPAPLCVLDDGTRSEADRLGAIGDLGLALRRVPPEGDFLVAAGDNLLEFDLATVLRAFADPGQSGGRPAARIVVRRALRDGDASPYNEVELDAEARVTRFREKPARPSSEWAAIALYLFPKTIATRVAEYLAAGENPDAPGHLLQWLVSREPVYASPLIGEWHDIGTPETLTAARARFE